MANRTVNTGSKSTTSGTKPKASKRRMKKQVRRTIGGLFLASAIAIAAIPVEPMSAKSTNSDYAGTTKNLVRAVHYKDSNNNVYEQLNGGAADTTWQSKVPYIDANEQVYVDESMTYQFAFVKENSTSTDYYAVILGAKTSAIDGSGSLTLPDTVDAYYAYASNTSSGVDSYCAVNKSKKYLYYKDFAQVYEDGKGYSYSTYRYPLNSVDTNSNPTSTSESALCALNLNAAQEPLNVWSITDSSKITTVPASVNGRTFGNLSYGDQAYAENYAEFEPFSSPAVVNPDLGYVEGSWVTKTAYYPLTPDMQASFVPCFINTVDKWSPGGSDVELFYWNKSSEVKLTDTSGFTSIQNSTDPAVQRVYKCAVRYIGMQTVKAKLDDAGNDTGTWTVTEPTTKTESDGSITTTPENGVFYNMGNLRNLEIGPNLAGIGDYAFYRCTALSSATFSNQLNTIGNGAFMGCNNLTEVNLDPWTDLSIIGASAFEGCSGLSTFDIPIHVFAIGDNAFKDCSGLTNLYMCGENADSSANMNLTTIGYNAFNNCSGLEYLEFPSTLTQKMPVHYLDGCTGLTRLKTNNNNFDIIDGDPDIDTTIYSGGYSETTEMSAMHNDPRSSMLDPYNKMCDIDEWINTLSPSFYFESNDSTALHKTAKDHSAAFLYDDTENAGCYEIVVRCEENPSHENTFVVDTDNNLVSSKIDPDCHVIEIPGHVGEYGVSNIAEGAFAYKCNLWKVYIPASVENIEAEAFKGCHNLNTVYFTDPYNYGLTIADNAFDTQDFVGTHVTGCTGLAGTPELNFVGAIDGNYAPFVHAMDENHNINVGSQPKTYIKYYSGWPTFLQVQYDPDKKSTGDENKLISYPTYQYLTDMNNAYIANPDKALKDYPYMSDDDFMNLKEVVDSNYWNGAGGVTLTQDQQTCADSIYNIVVPYGVESIEEGLFSNIGADGELAGPAPAIEDNHVNVNGANKDIKSVSLNSVKTVDPYTFAGLVNMESFDMTGGEEIGDYAFFGCKKLEDVSISGDVTKLGLRPFRDCLDETNNTGLMHVNFSGGNFICDDAIIYGLTGGEKTSVVECLESRGYRGSGESGTNGSTTVTAEELATVNSLAEEAFMNCDYIENIEFENSPLTTIPERAFAGTDNLYNVTLPESLTNIYKDAFLDSNARNVKIPGMNTDIADEYVFGQTVHGDNDEYDGYHSDGSDPIINNASKSPQSENNPYVNTYNVNRNVTLFTPEGSRATNYASDKPFISASKVSMKYKVYFTDSRNPGTYYDVQEVVDGDYAKTPSPSPEVNHPGYKMTGWYLNGSILTDVDTYQINGTTYFTALYEGDTVTVTFWVEGYDDDGNYIGNVVYTIDDVPQVQTISYGGNAATPSPSPHRDGYMFLGWDKDYSNVTQNLDVYARFEKIDDSQKHHVVFYNYDDTIVSEQYVADGEAAQTPTDPTRSGYKFAGWKPSDFTNVTKDMDIYAFFEKKSGGSSGGGGSGGGSSGGGSGGGESGGGSSGTTAKKYTVTVVNGSGSGTYEEGSTVIITANDPAQGKQFDKWTTGDVTLASTSLSATTFKMPGKNVTVTANYKDGSNSVKMATGNASRPVPTGQTAVGNTQVQVNRPGVSNIDIASAKVRGSNDSFIVKVTETNEATNAVENALNNRYGGLDSLKYWPCDISLYDSTGNTKISNVSGLSVEITLPIPDELKGYGGNNHVAAVNNNQLEELPTKFNTINGTPTVTFTATHFSPYVIYVDSNNLNASQMLDSSPKTGDPIHPKWFFVIGLFSASIVLFLIKDKKTVVAA